MFSFAGHFVFLTLAFCLMFSGDSIIASNLFGPAAASILCTTYMWLQFGWNVFPPIDGECGAREAPIGQLEPSPDTAGGVPLASGRTVLENRTRRIPKRQENSA